MAKKTARKAKSVKKVVRKPRKPAQKIDEKLLNLPHAGLGSISKSLSQIENFSSELAEKNGIVGVLGRAVLSRAKSIRESLKKPARKRSK